MGSSSLYPMSSYKGPRDWSKEASGFDFEYSSNFKLRLSPKANMIFFYINHIYSYMYVQYLKVLV